MDHNDKMLKGSVFGDFKQRLRKSFFSSFLIPSIEEMNKTYGLRYVEDFEKYVSILERAFPQEDVLGHLVDSYVMFNKEILKEEKYFQQNQEYSYSKQDYEKVCDQVYQSKDVMMGYYLMGLFLTYFCWPHHYSMINFYRENFLTKAGSSYGDMSFMDWGAGHGLFSLLAVEKFPQIKGSLYDISPFSISFASSLLKASGTSQQCRFFCEDILALKADSRCDFIICSELLEHLPDPNQLIQKIKLNLKPGGKAFLTAAINSAQKDHIYCFRSPKEVIDIIQCNGMLAQDYIELIHPNRIGHVIQPLVLAVVVENRG